MKPRKVIVTLDLETDAPIRDLKDKDSWDVSYAFPNLLMEVKQVQVNVVQEKKKG